MSFLSKVKKNEVKFGLDNYVFLVRGIPKIGKSQFYADVVKDMYGDESKGLLIPFEKGYSAIKDVNVFPYTITKEVMIDDVAYRGWEVFTGLVDELCSLSGDDKIRVIAIDTVDEFINVATEEVLRVSRIRTKKPCDSIDSAMGGFARGRKYLAYIIKEQIEKLRSAGIGIFFIGHTKLKTLKTKIDEQEYQILGSNLTEDFDRIFANDADFIIMISEDSNVVDGKLITGERYIRFRGDGFYSAGSRFPNVPEKVPFDTKIFIDVLKKAVMDINGISSDAEYKKEVKKEHKVQEDKIKHEKEVSDSMLEELLQRIKSFGSSPDIALDVKRELTEAILASEINMKEPLKNKLTSLTEIIERFNI